MKKILLVDDDVSIRTVFKRFLEGHGYEVDVAANGKEGLERLCAGNPDLVVTDIMMPDVDGLEILMAMKAMEQKPPVIAISGGMRVVPMDFLPLAKKLGAAKVLYKPVELDHLLSEVKLALSKS